MPLIRIFAVHVDAQLWKDKPTSAKLPLDKADRCNEDVLNLILWRATMGAKPYPKWAVKVVDDDRRSTCLLRNGSDGFRVHLGAGKVALLEVLALAKQQFGDELA